MLKRAEMCGQPKERKTKSLPQLLKKGTQALEAPACHEAMSMRRG
jgi:hypothetical protein